MELTQEAIDKLPLSEYPDGYDMTDEIINEALRDFDAAADVIDAECDRKQMGTEVAIVNKGETEEGMFPSEGWEVKVWSDDEGLPRVYVVRRGWNVSFRIDNGDMLEILNTGTDEADLARMKENMTRWLDARNITLPKLSNREAAMCVWEAMHG